MALLEVIGLEAGEAPPAAVRGVHLAVDEGEAVAVLGPDGAGKSLLARTLAGGLAPLGGSVVLGGERVSGLPPPGRVRSGLALVPQGGRVFAALSVRDNLRVGGWSRREDPGFVEGRRRRCLRLFPRLEPVLGRRAGDLPPLERQQLAIARALMTHPRLLVVDEPTWGLGADEQAEVLHGLRQVVEGGVAAVVLDRHVGVLDLVGRVLVLRDGTPAYHGPAADLRRDARLRRELLGVAAPGP